MSNYNHTKVSKLLSKALRHNPHNLGIIVDKNGWTAVDVLIGKVNDSGMFLDFNLLKDIVETNDKKRFAFNEDYTQIRANQGHTINVDLQLKGMNPPEVLYHGTIQRHIPSIFRVGLQKQKRHHVHLSEELNTAIKVGMRYGRPVILEIDAKQMHEDGIRFFLSENNVWLVDQVLPQYLKIKKE